jgi:hypothetical protein
MLRSAVRVLLVVATLFYGGDVAAQSPTSLSFEVAATEVVERHLLITLRNTGTKPITAWGVRGEVTFDGGSTQIISHVSDGYADGFIDARQQGEWTFVQFTPGLMLTGRSGIVLREPVVVSVVLTPHIVVFADSTALGDERVIQMVFATRVRERKAGQLIEDALARYIGTVADPAIAASLIDRDLQGLSDVDVRETRLYRTLRHNLALALKEPNASASLAVRLQALQTRNRSLKAAADAHSVRRE